MSAGLGPWLLALALALWPAGLWAQLRLQETGGGLRAAGDSVTLSCRGSGFTTWGYVWWYRQAPGGSPQWVSFISPDSSVKKSEPAMEGRALVSRDNSRSESSLSLQALGPRDSAWYFCAVHTGTGNPAHLLFYNTFEHLRKEGVIGISLSTVRTAKLIFGPGTTLTVEPNIPNSSVPQVIVMNSKKLEEGGSTGKAACLARNFLTKDISLEMPSKEVVYEQSTSILTSEGLYNAIKVVNVTKDTELTCTAKFNNRNITSLPEEEAEEPPEVPEAEEPGASYRVCNSTEPSARDPEGQRVNMLSMAVLGLRVLLAKSIAFNTLLSIKLFLF
ncbi:immunoglobulin gamma-1 heavy chain-like [Aphelocoma coerulescens]|uniref:immunoglobulin gamma-1 heavy chain-like n=1 Tax=Aphelocoma coerulescens TaxID=39617 RepID=UPI0036043A53